MFADRCKELRKQCKLTQDELADLVNVKGKQAVSNWENGNTVPTLQCAVRLAEVFGVTVDYLVTDNDDEKLLLDISDLSEQAQELATFTVFKLKNMSPKRNK